jgi:predicted CopG family antitoxin
MADTKPLAVQEDVYKDLEEMQKDFFEKYKAKKTFSQVIRDLIDERNSNKSE